MKLDARFVRNVIANLDKFEMPQEKRDQIKLGWFFVQAASELAEVPEDFKAELKADPRVRAFLGFMFLINQTKGELAAA